MTDDFEIRIYNDAGIQGKNPEPSSVTGIEPMSIRLLVRMLNHWAKRASE